MSPSSEMGFYFNPYKTLHLTKFPNLFMVNYHAAA